MRFACATPPGGASRGRTRPARPCTGRAPGGRAGKEGSESARQQRTGGRRRTRSRSGGYRRQEAPASERGAGRIGERGRLDRPLRCAQPSSGEPVPGLEPERQCVKNAICAGHAPVTGCPRRATTAPTPATDPVTATVDVGPGYLPGSPAPVTVEDLISVLPTVPSTWVPARPPPIPHTAHRPRRGVQSAVGEDRQPCAARALSSRANAASRACAVPRRPV